MVRSSLQYRLTRDSQAQLANRDNGKRSVFFRLEAPMVSFFQENAQFQAYDHR